MIALTHSNINSARMLTPSWRAHAQAPFPRDHTAHKHITTVSTPTVVLIQSLFCSMRNKSLLFVHCFCQPSQVFPDVNEDPGLFVDTRGNFHILTHNFASSGPGGHAFSKDGLSWTFAGGAYNSSGAVDFTIRYENGTSVRTPPPPPP